MKKKITFLLACILLMTCFCTIAFATDAPYQNVLLEEDETYDRTLPVEGTHKWVSGTNALSSERSVYYDVQRSTVLGYTTDVKFLIGVGASLEDTLTSFTNKSVSWRLELNPYGVNTKGCLAFGYIWYDM